MGFCRQEYWSGWPLPSPGYLLDPVTEAAVSCIGRHVLYCSATWETVSVWLQSGFYYFQFSESCQREQDPEVQTINLTYKLLAYRVVNCMLTVTRFRLNGHEPSGSFYLRGQVKCTGFATVLSLLF